MGHGSQLMWVSGSWVNPLDPVLNLMGINHGDRQTFPSRIWSGDTGANCPVRRFSHDTAQNTPNHVISSEKIHLGRG